MTSDEIIDIKIQMYYDQIHYYQNLALNAYANDRIGFNNFHNKIDEIYKKINEIIDKEEI